MVCRMRTFRVCLALALAACSSPPPVVPPGTTDAGRSGAPCKSGNACQADAGFSCVLGICSRVCSDTQPCGNNEVCGELSGKKRCLSLCEGDTCAAGSACQTFWPTRQRVCAQAPLFGACKSVVNTTPCALCSKANFTSVCADGDVCPSSSTCGITEAGGLGCYCEPGFEAFACDGTRCSQPNGNNICVPGEYACLPTELPAETCVTESHGSAGSCVCADGRRLPFICGETDSCEHRCATGCNYAQSDCVEQTKKCSLVYDVAAETIPTSAKRDRPVCTDLLGNKQLGQSCRRVPRADGGLEWRRDDCGLGLTCEATAGPRGDPHCNKTCTASSGCASDETCAFDGLTYPPAGECIKVKACTVGGTECGPGRSCRGKGNVERTVVTYCKYDGLEVQGASCSTEPEDAGGGCGPDLACRKGKCAPTCSAQKPCATGKCDTDFGIPNVLGVCE